MRRTLAVVVLALLALALPGTARAGGPTSVLITSPGGEQATALYYTSSEYAELERILTEDPTTSTGLPPDLESADQYNLTWMIHDVQPWRFDTVHVTGDGTAYVTTGVSDVEVEGGVQQSKGRVVAQGKALVALLDRLLAGGKAGPPARTEPSPAAAPGAALAPAPAAPAPETRWFSLTGWRWVVPGLLAGLLAGAGLGLARARRSGPVEARRVLVDRPPERAGT